jgi:putative aldouronate transport system permease protein
MIIKANTWRDKTFNFANIVFMLIIVFITLFPFWNAMMGSFNDGLDYMKGGVNFLTRKFSLINYQIVFMDATIINAYKITFLRTIVATGCHVIFTALFAYGFSKKNLIGRNAIAIMGLITLLFSGGLIPYYMVIKSLGLVNHFLVYIIPGLFNFFDVLIFQAFFREIPESVVESAKLDGAHEYTIFFRIILPISMPVIAAIVLFTGIYNWNAYFDCMIFTSKPELQTIMIFLLKIVRTQQAATALAVRAADMVKNPSVSSKTIQLATMMVTTIPIIAVYPFLQRYFIKGLLLGSVKG